MTIHLYYNTTINVTGEWARGYHPWVGVDSQERKSRNTHWSQAHGNKSWLLQVAIVRGKELVMNLQWTACIQIVLSLQMFSHMITPTGTKNTTTPQYKYNLDQPIKITHLDQPAKIGQTNLPTHLPPTVTIPTHEPTTDPRTGPWDPLGTH